MVLAACESGVGVGYEGNEMLGFVSALFARGTAGAGGQHAGRPGRRDGRLDAHLHEGVLAGDTLAQALHGARADVDCDEPAGFVDWCAWNAYGAA